MMTASAIKPFVVAPSAARAQKPRTPRAPISCSASKDVNVPAFGIGALAAAQLALGAPAFADVSFDSDKFGAPSQNKEATNLPSTFFKTGDSLQEKLGFNTDADNLKNRNSGGAANAPNLSGNQADAKVDGAISDVGSAGKKAVDNITPDLSELPSPQQLASKGKSAAQSAGSKLPNASQAANKGKSLANDLGNKAKSATGGIGNKNF